MTSTDTAVEYPAMEAGATTPVQGRPAVNSWDEFTTLREVIVGDATDAWMPDVDVSIWLSCYPEMTATEIAAVRRGAYPRRVIEESNEDLEVLTDTLRRLGVVTHRMPRADNAATISSPDWTTQGFYSYCPRDLTLVVGRAIIETPSVARARYFEVLGLHPLFNRKLKEGAIWFSAPRPRLDEALFEWDESGRPLLGETEPIFDAANILRLGKDIFYQVSRSGNETGLCWLRSTLALLGDFRVHPLRGIYGNTHIDSTIAFLRPGLLLLNPARISPDRVPQALRGWDIIWCPPPQPAPLPSLHPLSEEWITMNLLMVRPDLAIVDHSHLDLVHALERHGIEVLPHRLRHSRILGGGFHCVTLDLVRDGGHEDYLC
jgi:glycine amidinotransferase